jgi:hypothetical protein
MLSHITEDSLCDNLQACTRKVLFEVFVCHVITHWIRQLSGTLPYNTDKTLRTGFVIEGPGEENERQLRCVCLMDLFRNGHVP